MKPDPILRLTLQRLIWHLVISTILCMTCSCDDQGLFSPDNQFSQLMRDRPQLLYHDTSEGPKPLPNDFPVRKWALEKFRESAKRGVPIVWDSTTPWDGANGSRSTFLENPVYFRLSGTFFGLDEKARHRSSEDLWFSLIYGLGLNDYSDEQEALYRSAAAREISKDEFTEKLAFIHHENMAQSLKVVEDIWLPWAIKNRSFTIPSSKIWDEFEPDFETWFLGLTGDEQYPFKLYSDFYELIDDRLAINDSWKEALIDSYSKIERENIDRDTFEALKPSLDRKKDYEAKLFEYTAGQSRQ